MKKFRAARSVGLTLLELLCVMAVLSILAMGAAPAFSAFVERQRVHSAASALTSSLFLVRTSAQQRRHHVTLCASDEGEFCRLTEGWGAGLLIFEDHNRNGIREPGEPVMKFVPLENRVRIFGNTPVRSYIMYSPQGHAQLASGAFQAGTVSICPLRSSTTRSTQIVMNKAGRIRTAQGPVGSCLF